MTKADMAQAAACRIVEFMNTKSHDPTNRSRMCICCNKKINPSNSRVNVVYTSETKIRYRAVCRDCIPYIIRAYYWHTGDEVKKAIRFAQEAKPGCFHDFDEYMMSKRGIKNGKHTTYNPPGLLAYAGVPDRNKRSSYQTKRRN